MFFTALNSSALQSDTIPGSLVIVCVLPFITMDLETNISSAEIPFAPTDVQICSITCSPLFAHQLWNTILTAGIWKDSNLSEFEMI